MKNNVVNITFGVLLAILAIVPFAIPYAYFPLSKFYSESVSLIVGVFIFALAVFSKDKIKLPPVAIACFLFAIFALIQPLFVHIYFPGNNHYLAMIFIICGLVAVGVSSLIEDSADKLRKFMIFMSWALVISATIQAIIAYLQYTGKAANLSEYILYSDVGAGDGSNIFGNIGQPNQFTDFISIGVVALVYLFVVGQINVIVFAAYALLFACAITFTARRGVLLYFIIMMFTGAWVLLRNWKNEERKLQYKKILLTIVAFFVGLMIVQFAMPKVVAMFSTQVANTVTGVERFSADQIGQSTYRRFYEWYKAIILFTEHPFFGVGWYQYPREGIYIMQTERFSYIPMNMKLYTHCHNSLFNIMAETGIFGTVILIGYGIGYSIFSLLRRLNSVEGVFAVLLSIPILTHSFLEYPLWYAYFMVLLTVFLAFAPSTITISNKVIHKTIGGIIFAILMLFAYDSYQVNTQLTSYTQTPSDFDDYSSNVAGLEQFVDSNSIWSLPAMMVLDNYIMPGSQATSAVIPPAKQLEYVDKLANALPYPGALLKQIIVHKMAGDNEGANKYANILAHAYPYYQAQFIKQLSSSPEFADVVATMQAFHYEDKSDLSKIFK